MCPPHVISSIARAVDVLYLCKMLCSLTAEAASYKTTSFQGHRYPASSAPCCQWSCRRRASHLLNRPEHYAYSHQAAQDSSQGFVWPRKHARGEAPKQRRPSLPRRSKLGWGAHWPFSPACAKLKSCTSCLQQRTLCWNSLYPPTHER